VRARQLALLLTWAVGLGFLTALPLGVRQRISIEIWFITLVLWTLVSLVLALMRAAPLSSTSHVDLRPWLPDRWRRTRDDMESQLRDHRAIEGLLIRARDNERSHSRQLRPRLESLAGHYLPLRHGVDPSSDPSAVSQVLGDVGWLIDPAVDDRRPTFEQVDRFLDLTVGPLDPGPVQPVDPTRNERP